MGDALSSGNIRLGKRELGRHAFEERMPGRIAALLENENSSNDLSSVIPRLASLIAQDTDVKIAYLCTDHAVQISKLDGEGAHFCGYRNMQMLCLSIARCEYGEKAANVLHSKLSVHRLQAMIEEAWDQGINAHARALTGGIKNTRKHVGTSEAEALLLSLDVACTGTAFKGVDAWRALLDHVEQYFHSFCATAGDGSDQVRRVSCPTIFLQRPRHSVTIVGIEKLTSGERHLLVFDPAWQPPAFMQRDSFGTQFSVLKRWTVLNQYRKGQRYLKKYQAFEILTVDNLPS